VLAQRVPPQARRAGLVPALRAQVQALLAQVQVQVQAVPQQ
jgi:hypothetical protein